MTRYTSVTESDREAMLTEIGISSIEDLFADIPESLRLKQSLDLPGGKSEQEVYSELRRMAAKNVSAEDEICFLGAGMYDHYVPALIDSILSRSEFLTPYTPYQPEISQGGLQVMFEFQTAISELTDLPISNASVYDGPSALAAAGCLAKLHNNRTRFLVSRGVHPHARMTLETMCVGYGIDVEEIPLADGVTDAEALKRVIGPDVGAVFISQPNFLGSVEDLEVLTPIAQSEDGLCIVNCDPMTLGVLRPPGDFGVDVAVGEGQALGNRLDFGGPSFGFFAADDRYMRKMPGRIAGETVDVDGRRGFVLTLQTREQHIRRERATSNICTAQALNALAGVIYLTWLGRRGFVELGELLLQRTDYARCQLSAIEGVGLIHDQPVVREFAVSLPVTTEFVIEHCAARGVNPGYDLSADYPEYGNGLLIALTEQRSKADIDRLVACIQSAIDAGNGAGNGRLVSNGVGV